MNTYNYTRESNNGKYNINNPDRVDGGGLQIYLANEIEAVFPGVVFYVRCNGSSVAIIFPSYSLSDAEKTSLDTIVSDHKNNL